jgi:hypothetical protein
MNPSAFTNWLPGVESAWAAGKGLLLQKLLWVLMQKFNVLKVKLGF